MKQSEESHDVAGVAAKDHGQPNVAPDDASVCGGSKATQAQDREEAAIEQYKKVLPKLGFNNSLMFELD
jgi:hypothetical protein